MQTTKFFTGQRITLLIILAFIAFVLGSFIGTRWQKPLADQVSVATILPTPRTISPFHLTDMHNHSFTNQSLLGHWTLMFFGFTNCGYICPTTMGALKQVYNTLQTNKQPLPQIMFISIDPERDTPQKIQQYVTSFDPNFLDDTGFC